MASIGRTSTPTSVPTGNTYTDRPAIPNTLTNGRSKTSSPFPPSQNDTNTKLNGHKDDTPDNTDRLIQELSSHNTNTLPLWAQMTKLNPPEPNPRCTPYIWRYNDIKPYLLRAGNLITEKQAERRVLMLINPARNEAPYTTDTIYGGLQLVMPNETAPAHRHVAFAMRFIVEGDGGFTAVHGKRVTMQRGDVILTPVWNWHDHGNGGKTPMIWLDGLDLPLFRHFPVHFVEHFKEPRYPAEDIDSETSPIVFPWHKMKATLDSKGGAGESGKQQKWVRERYLREDGSEVSHTLGGAAERIPPNSSSPAFRETSSSIYHVISGTGYSIIGGDTRLDWNTGDTFCVPSWMEYVHFNTTGTGQMMNGMGSQENGDGTRKAEGQGVEGEEAGQAAYLYRCDDEPMIRRLGFYRRGGDEGEDVEGRYAR